ncbi:MAG: TolB family protein, partial [Armatimonadota bacterium]
MRWWLTTLTLTIAIAVSGIQASAQPLTVWWLSFVANGNAQVPIRINPATGLVDSVNGVFVDSRFPSLSADGRQVVFQIGNGTTAQIWQAVWDATNGRWQVSPVPIPQTDPPRPLIGFHPVISADGNHIAFASWQDYRPGASPGAELSKLHIYVLDRLQNRIVPISFLWRDKDGDGMRDNFVHSDGNCVPVAISADGRIVVFLAEWLPDNDLSVPNHTVPPDPDTDPPLSVDHAPLNQESRLYIVDENGDGRHEPLQIPPTNQPQKWLVLIHDRDADGNGVYDEAGIGATRTFVGSLDFVPSDPTNPFPVPAASISVSANGRIIAFMTTYNNDLDRQVDEDPPGDINGDGVLDDDGDGRDDEDPIDEQWRVIVRDWQSNAYVTIDNAYAPALSDDGTYLAYLQPTAALNEPSPTYLQSKMNLVVQRIERDPNTGRLTLGPSLSLTDLTLPAQSGTADGSAGWGYSDWWGAVTIAVDPRDPNVVYAAFHAWSTDLVDLSLVRSDLVVDGTANAPP